MLIEQGRKLFLNKEVSQIVGVTPRQVLSWTEKGLVVPFKESTGSHTKRYYDYVNLLELGLCKRLFDLGMGFRAIKKMVGHLKRTELIKEWAINFSGFYINQWLQQRMHVSQAIERFQKQGRPVHDLRELQEEYLKEPDIPEDPTGVLLYFFDDKGENTLVVPWKWEGVVNLNIMKDYLTKSKGAILIDLGEIKSEIDSKA